MRRTSPFPAAFGLVQFCFLPGVRAEGAACRVERVVIDRRCAVRRWVRRRPMERSGTSAACDRACSESRGIQRERGAGGATRRERKGLPLRGAHQKGHAVPKARPKSGAMLAASWETGHAPAGKARRSVATRRKMGPRRARRMLLPENSSCGSDALAEESRASVRSRLRTVADAAGVTVGPAE